MIISATAEKGRRVFTRSVPREDGRGIKRRYKKCRCRMTLMMLDVMEFEVARPEVFTQPLWMFEHPQIAVTHLGNAPVGPRLEHARRNKGCLRCLHRLMAEDPGLPIMADVLHVL